jgi:hypothetical protein
MMLWLEETSSEVPSDNDDDSLHAHTHTHGETSWIAEPRMNTNKFNYR